MNFTEIEERVAEVGAAEEPEFLFELLRAYGIPKASITRLRSGSCNRSDQADEYLWKNKVYYRSLDCPDEELYAVVDAAKAEDRVLRERPRFAIARNESRLVAVDLKTSDALDIEIKELHNHAAFFLPWAGIEKTQIENQNLADIKAAEKMAKLYDEIVRHNAVETEEQIHELNVFFSRLLFSFFAEDTGVFEKGSFTTAIESLSLRDGKDLHELLDQIFDVLNAEVDARVGYPSHLLRFGYVNGKLFERHSSAPRFTAKARSLVLDCGTLDWSQINPDIFGSMIQAVVHPSQRGKLGMHYTSVENIRKVLRPLFLDDLEAEFEGAQDSAAKLDRLLDRLAAIRIFDPACGSGNFLVIAYKELRRLEHSILERISELKPSRRKLFEFSRIPLDNFYGIEIDDFAHEIATLSLWLAKHQMNVKFKELFGVEIPLIPLREAGNINCGNATRLDWSELLGSPSLTETYLCSNPPYLGSRNQTASNKADLKLHHPRYKSLDYVAAWVIMAAEVVANGRVKAAGLVTTNSITQGEQVGLLWPGVFGLGVELGFAHTAFRWTNDARRNAGVTCVVLGLRQPAAAPRKLYSLRGYRLVKSINAYLADGASTTVSRRSTPLSAQLPRMTYGCLLNDGGGLVLESVERDRLLDECPESEEWIKPLIGAKEFLNGSMRWCLYISDQAVSRAARCSHIQERLNSIKARREASSEKSTRELAGKPNRFYFDCYQDAPAIIVPNTSSERRKYVPIGYLSPGTIITHSASAIYGAESWLFGLIQSRMHMTWLGAVGGRLESRYRYSAALVYNTFPVPNLSSSDRDALKAGAFAVLAAREQFPDRTLGEIYDPDEMPPGLRDAHEALDETVDQLYRSRSFESDEERLKVLFAMYEEMVAEQEVANA